MIEIVKVAILGIVEGVTEFLPISSTGHLLVTSALLNSEVANRLGGTFEIFIQIGAVLAVVAYYRLDLYRQIRTFPSDPNVRHLWYAVIIASFPAGTIGFLTRDFIKRNLFTQDVAPLVVATMLIIGGIIFIIVEKRANYRSTFHTEHLSQISFTQALLIGFMQTLALIPGVSRSGATILGAMLVGINRPVATAFSFYLAIPVLGGATIVDLLLSIDTLTRADLGYLLLGALVSGIVAWVAIDWLLHYVSTNNFVIFGYYRIFAGVIILLFIILGIV